MHNEPCKSIWIGQVFKDHADLKYSLFSKVRLHSHEGGRARSHLKQSLLKSKCGIEVAQKLSYA